MRNYFGSHSIYKDNYYPSGVWNKYIDKSAEYDNFERPSGIRLLGTKTVNIQMDDQYSKENIKDDKEDVEEYYRKVDVNSESSQHRGFVTQSRRSVDLSESTDYAQRTSLPKTKYTKEDTLTVVNPNNIH